MESPRIGGSEAWATGSGTPSSKSSPERGRLIVISGPSGVGKSTIVDRLQHRRSFYFSVSVTTRSPRPDERDGVDYHFVDPERFRLMAADGSLLEWAEYNGRLYGTPRRAVEEALAAGRDVLLDIEIRGALQVKEAYPAAVTIFIEPPSAEVLEARLRGRGDTSAAEVEGRLQVARWQTEVARRHFDHLVVNDEVDAAVDRILRILTPPDEGSP